MFGRGMEGMRKARYTLSKDYLSGVGMELGAGPHPQELPPNVVCKYFDKYDQAFVEQAFAAGKSLPYTLHSLSEVGTHFPMGADFLIAHNVLEHCENPIRTLIEWFGYVRDGGIMVVGLPLPTYCPQDTRRVPTPFKHILEDYLFDRDQADFESCEHVYSFRLGWREDKAALTKDAYLDFIQDEALRKGHDIHWHVGGYELFHKTLLAAAYFAHTGVELLASSEAGEALFVCRLTRNQTVEPSAVISAELSALRAQLNLALARLATVAQSEDDAALLRRQLANQRLLSQALDQRLQGILLSREWRIAAPISKAIGALKKLKRLIA
jgi:SAM-dependent methyltransferase